MIYPEAGYGSCFPKDGKTLARSADKVGFPATLLNAVESVCDRQKMISFDKIRAPYDGELSGKKIALWSLAFKPNTDDMWEASSRVLKEALWRGGAIV